MTKRYWLWMTVAAIDLLMSHRKKNAHRITGRTMNKDDASRRLTQVAFRPAIVRPFRKS
jgi:hypothetical protein